MILVRNTFQAKYGKGDELVALIKEFNGRSDTDDGRILVDMSGTFFTVIAESEHESMGAFEQSIAAQMEDSEFSAWFGEWFRRMCELVESGNREFFRIV